MLQWPSCSARGASQNDNFVTLPGYRRAHRTLSARPHSAQTQSSTTAQPSSADLIRNAPGDDHVSGRHRPVVRPDRPRSSATGNGRPAFIAAAPTTSRGSRTSAISPGTFAVRTQGSRRDFRLPDFRHAHRPRPPAALHERSRGRRRRRSVSVQQSRLDRQQSRRLLVRRESEPHVGVPPAAGGALRPRRRQDADRRQGRGRVDGQTGLRVRSHRQQGDGWTFRCLRVRRL